LLPTGDVLIAGGINAGGVPVNSTELFLASKDGSYVSVGNMSVARASATATVLPNGLILIAGGIDASGTVRPDVEVYNPAARTFGSVVAFQSGHAHYNHTATLLKSGNVLLCGGIDNTGNVTGVCDYYTPTGVTAPGGALCSAGAGSGCTSIGPSLASARAFHTATLLKDGTVLFAGGWNPAATATNGWLTTMEKFNSAGSGSFGSAANLFEARGYHTATMMGDGKVLIAGGFNGNEVGGNLGTLGTEEIYDPQADATTPAAQLNTRRQMHSAVLSADGSVVFFGGLGNITTSYTSAAMPITDATALLSVSFSGVQSFGNMTTSGEHTNFPAGFSLSEPVVGTIVTGSILFSTPSLNFGSGIAYFVPGSSDPASGLQANLSGVNVTCSAPGNITSCGYIDPSQVMPLTNMNQGQIFFSPLLAVTNTGSATAGSMNFSGGPLTATNQGPLSLNSNSTFTADLAIPMPLNTIGATISSGTLHFNSATFVQTSSYAVTLTGADDVSLPTGITIVANGSGAVLNVSGVVFTDVLGAITWTGGFSTYQLSSPAGVGLDGVAPAINVTANINYVPSQVNVTGANIQVSVSSVVIRSMVFGSPEYFIPNANQAVLAQPNGNAPTESVNNERFGHTATLLPNNDLLYVGGIACTDFAGDGGGCGPLVPKSDGPPTAPRDTQYVIVNNNSSSAGGLLNPRALHTATLLPNGKILVAGGTNGPSVLNSAELYNPATQTSVATAGPMFNDRDLHSATLLPDGRVLIAGGFTTNAFSTDSTNGAEIYYPDTSVFIPTGSMNVARRGHTATLLSDGTVMVIGGMTTGGTIIGTSEIYRSTTSVWEVIAATAPLLPARTGHTATLLKDGTVLVIGGTNSVGPLNSVYRFNPMNPTAGWAAQASLPTALYQHTATMLFDGRVLVAGGNNGFGEISNSYIFDPQANTWTSVGALFSPRYGHTATLLPNGTVMISGGNTRSGVVPVEIEVFHVDASAWESLPGVGLADGPRTFHTMTLTPDGGVYALGGSNGAIGGSGTSLYTAVDRSYFTTTTDLYTKNAPPSVRQSSITAATALIQAGPSNTFTVSGSQFRGGTEASGGGSASANSSFSFPHLLLQQIDGSGGGSSQSNSGFVLDLTTQVYLNSGNYPSLDSSLTVALPASAAQLPVGWYNARVGADDLYSNGVFVQVGPPKPTSAATGLAGTTQGISSITWTWNAVAGVDGYDIYQASTTVFIGTAPATGSPKFIETGLPPNAQVQVLVAPYTLSGDGPTAVSPFASVNQSAAIGLIGCGSNNSGATSTSIQWNWSDAGSVLHYNVYDSSTGVQISTAPNGSPVFLDVGLGTNTQRSIYVSAVTADGLGPLSASASCYTLAAAPGPFTPLMTSTATTSVSLNWTNDGNPIGTLYQASFTGYPGTQVVVTTVSVAQTGTGVLSAYLGNLSPGAYYSASVAAFNGAGVASTPLTMGTTFTLPAQPQPITIQGTTPISITASWNTNANSTMTIYQLTYSTDNFVTNVATAVPFSSRFNSATFTITGLLTSTQYWLRTQAENPYGQLSQLSASVATVTFNGGAPTGSLAGVLTAAGSSEFFGNLGGPSVRTINLRSPGGAFPVDTSVTISTYDVSPGDHGPLCPNGVPGLGSSGVVLSIVDSPALQPTNPLFLIVSYANAELGPTPTSQLSLERFDPASGTCVPLPTTFNTAAHTFLAQLNHFSLYQLVAVPLATSADTARIYPNPYRAATDGFVTIDMVPPTSRVRVFTLRGERILDATADGTGTVTWAADNTAGRPIASGLYLVVIEGGGAKKIMKLAVIR
jgi:N-acetylneuraminic acid mutarotase